MKIGTGTARRAGCGCIFLCAFAASPSTAEANELLALSFNDLLNAKISSVTKREQLLQEAAASIYVITAEAIQNSGVTTLPEALRLDPRLQVSRITATQYAIGIRGFTTDTNNKLLVMIDGRTIYTSLFSGVFWDHQDLLIDDIERIEVISGPGSTLWGTNAVNGVINIITKNSANTTGWHTGAHAGNLERGAHARYGSAVGDHGHFRVYGKYYEVDTNERVTGLTADDGAQRTQVGFRADWQWQNDQLTLMGDAYHGTGDDRGVFSNPAIGDRYLGDIEVSGNHFLARWQHTFSGGSDLQLRAYWDRFKRKDAILFQPEADTWDIELQHTLPIGRHRLLWGAGYRYSDDKVTPGLATYFIPDSRSLEWINVFIMSEFNLTDTADLTLGIRREHNPFTGMEYLPTARISWQHTPNNLSWLSLSRAIRAPSRFDRDVYYGLSPEGPWIVQGGPNFVSEVANVLQIGHRAALYETFCFSLTAYYHDWERLRSATAVPVELVNDIYGKVYGVEAWANWQVMPRWQLAIGGTRLYKDLQLKPGSQDPVGVDNVTLANDADYYGQIRSTLEVTATQSLEVAARYVGELINQGVPSYTSVDVHYAYQLHPNLKLTFTAQNIGNRIHYEYGDDDVAVTFGRSTWLRLIWEP